MLGINGQLLDFIYPIGSYYETSDTAFNPNTSWGGTWVEDSAGRVTVALDNDDSDFKTIGNTGGEKAHTLTIDEMPSHSHKADLGDRINASGVRYGMTTGTLSYSNADVNGLKNTGGSQPHNILQPYIIVKRWHRTA